MQISDNEIYLLIKYIKSILWRVAKCLSYIEEVRCLKVKMYFRSFQVGVFHSKESTRLCVKSSSITDFMVFLGNDTQES